MRGLVRIVRWIFRLGLVLALILAAALAYDSMEPPVSTLMLARRLTGAPTTRDAVPLSDVPCQRQLPNGWVSSQGST